MRGKRIRSGTGALVTAFLLLTPVAAASLRAQDTTARTPPARQASAAPAGTRLRVVFRAPTRGVRRDGARSHSSDVARALIPGAGVDTLIPQTIRATPFVAICASGQPDSAWLRVRVGTTMNDVMIALRPGLNRIGLGAARVVINDGDVAEWSLASRSGQLLVQELLERRVVRSTPTANSLATNGVWYDALDQFVSASQRGGDPLADARLDAFVRSVGERPCAGPHAP